MGEYLVETHFIVNAETSEGAEEFVKRQLRMVGLHVSPRRLLNSYVADVRSDEILCDEIEEDR